MTKEMWEGFSEDNILVYQVDSLLLRRNKIDQFIATNYPFIGAYGPGVGSDKRSPKGFGMNGGLSLRSRKAMIHCLNNVTSFMVNDYRTANGLETTPNDPANGIYMPEDIYYYHALEMLGYPLPPVEIQSQFSIQNYYIDHPLGLHGYDKGWYLSSAQLTMLLQE